MDMGDTDFTTRSELSDFDSFGRGTHHTDSNSTDFRLAAIGLIKCTDIVHAKVNRRYTTIIHNTDNKDLFKHLQAVNI